MEYKRFDNTIFVRLDPGEEIITELGKVILKENVKLASVSGLGAVNEITVGVFKTAEKEYMANHFAGYYEIVSLTGTVTTMNGEPYFHLHMSAGNEKGEVFGGHLNKAVISATGEIVIQVVNGSVGRKFSDEIGLNLFSFEEVKEA